jgi:2,3-bisphosphoglycerate-independent phosphoglycerate mutase
LSAIKRPFALIILDGWGLAAPGPYNAISQAHTPAFDALYNRLAWTSLDTSGEAVGLPAGQMGNSEVGHLNIGSGRVVYQESVRISKAIRDGDFFQNAAFTRAMDMARTNGKAVHLYGLLSDGGVHSYQTHLYALLRLAKLSQVSRVYVHACLDGRDTPPRSAVRYMTELLEEMQRQGCGEVATVMGRYYSMDRDQRWERTAQAYVAMVDGEGRQATDAVAAIERSYQEEKSDEFVVPVVMHRANGAPVGTIQQGDVVICFNFRADRVRQLTTALTDPDFTGFPRRHTPEVHYVCMTHYSPAFDLPMAFPQQSLDHLLAEVFATHHIPNARIAETEKYAHVTYFLNGGVEAPFAYEDRILIPSPKVATYDLQPEMSAYPVTEAAMERLHSVPHGGIILNFANADMVGHTGNMAATIQAIETLDTCVGRIVETVQTAGGWAVVTADHGNAEQMFDPVTQSPHTAHTTNPVPFILCDNTFHGQLRQGGALCDVAPTLLHIMGLTPPAAMTGTDLRVTA